VTSLHGLTAEEIWFNTHQEGFLPSPKHQLTMGFIYPPIYRRCVVSFPCGMTGLGLTQTSHTHTMPRMKMLAVTNRPRLMSWSRFKFLEFEGLVRSFPVPQWQLDSTSNCAVSRHSPSNDGKQCRAVHSWHSAVNWDFIWFRNKRQTSK